MKDEVKNDILKNKGSVTYIGGCGDTPEKVAQVNAINKAKREKEAKQRKNLLERSQQETYQQRLLIERKNQDRILVDFLKENGLYIMTNDVTASSHAVSSHGIYENKINNYN